MTPQDLPGQKLKGHIWLATSGTTSSPKWVALSKDAILTSAGAVNQHLKSDASDVWVNPLPDFHVGGLGIWARSFLSGTKVYPFKPKRWDVYGYHRTLHDIKATLTSLVPTQVYDLVHKKLQPPQTLRAIIVGGGALPESLYHEAIQLGWRLLPSFGLTECASQVATAKHGSKDLHILPHVTLKIDDDGYICIKSTSLLTTYSTTDPKVNGWFKTEDKGHISEKCQTYFYTIPK